MKVNHSNYKDYAGAVPDHEQVAGDGGGREGRSAAVKAVHYQEFINGRGGGEKKTERTERKASARSVKSNYVYYIVKRSDGSTLILPIIKV